MIVTLFFFKILCNQLDTAAPTKKQNKKKKKKHSQFVELTNQPASQIWKK
jgi:hypothetical protein